MLGVDTQDPFICNMTSVNLPSFLEVLCLYKLHVCNIPFGYMHARTYV